MSTAGTSRRTPLWSGGGRPGRWGRRPGGGRHTDRRGRAEREEVGGEAGRAERAYDMNKAAELRMGKLPELERRLAAEEDHLASKQGSARLLREVVTDEEIAQIVSRWTGIPVTRLQEGEREKLLRLGEILHQRIVGQDKAGQGAADTTLPARPR